MSYLMPHYTASDPATTVRPSSTSLFVVDSEDRFPDYNTSRGATSTSANISPYSFTISRAESLMNGFASRLGVTEINFPWGIPNINVKTKGMSFTYDDGRGPTTLPITLTTGFYTPAELATAIQSLVTPAVPTFTIAYGVNNNPAFSYATGGTTTIGFNALAYNSAAYPWPTQTKQLFDLLGFTEANAALTTTGAGSFTFCQSIRYVDIVSPTLVYNQANRDTMSQNVSRNALCRIYLGDGGGSAQSSVSPSDPFYCPPGCAPLTIYRNFTQPKQIQWLGNQPIPGNLQFTVYDDTGAPLTEILTGGALQGEFLDWSMTILISEN